MGHLTFVHRQLALPSRVSYFLPSCSAICDATKAQLLTPAKEKPFKGTIFRGHQVAADNHNGRFILSSYTSLVQLLAGLTSCLELWVSAMSV